MATQTMKHATIRKASLFKQPPNKRISIKQLNMKMALLVINGLAFIIMTFFLHSHKTQHQQSQQATLQAQAQQQQQSSSSSTPFTTDSTSSVNTNKRKIPPLQILQQQLERLSIPYYVHSDPRIAQPNITDNLVQNRGRGRLKERFRPEALLEHAVLEAIERHPMRTYDVTRAQLFIIPLRVGANVIHRGHHLPQVVETLAQHSHWNYGHGHVLVALNSATFSYEHRTDVARHGLTKRIYEFFANVTVVKSMDDFACAKLTHTHTATTTTTTGQQQQQQQSMASHHNKNKNDNNDDYRDLFAESVHTMSRYGFSLGLLAEPSLPYIKASYNHTLARSNVVFYRTRVNASFYNSTQYRHAPILLLNNNNNNNNNNSQQSQQSRLPQPSCVGFDMNATEWLQEFTNSKFCLAIRGDTPHTHALIRAVKVGCIPVVISDHYPMYAPTFASTMGDMTRFSIFIPEHDFLINPEGSIRSLMTTRSTQDIKIKLKELRFAQRVLLYDHPKSLFVQAFMKEALLATQMPPSKYCFV